jgi:DNA-binding PadR family transcriptional regulator
VHRTTHHHPRSGHPRRDGPHARGGFDAFGADLGLGPALGRRGARRGRRGDVRRAVLSLLAEEPMNGYQIITAIAERSDGAWQPGPGSVYPALHALHEDGLVDPVESGPEGVLGRRKVHALSDAGRAHVEEHAEELKAAWEQSTAPQVGFRELRQEVHQLHGAIQQVGMSGRPEAIDAARKALAGARRAIYRLLAEDETPAG